MITPKWSNEGNKLVFQRQIHAPYWVTPRVTVTGINHFTAAVFLSLLKAINPLFFMVFSRVSTKNKDHCSYDRHVCLFYILLSTLDLWDAGTIPGLSLPQVVMVGHLVDGPQCPSARHRWFHSIPMLRPIPIWPSFASRQSPFIFSHYLLRNKFTFDFYFVLSKLHSRIWLPSGKPYYQ